MNAAEETLAVAQVRAWLRSGQARKIRERAGISQADLALAAGTSGPQVSRWECGYAVPVRGSALKLAKLYKELEEIIVGEEREAC